MTAKQAGVLREQLLDSLSALHGEFEFFHPDGPEAHAIRKLLSRKNQTPAKMAAIIDELLDVMLDNDPDDDEDPEEDDPEEDEREADPGIFEYVQAAAGAIAPSAAAWFIGALAQTMAAPPTMIVPPPDFAQAKEAEVSEEPVQNPPRKDSKKVIDITDFRPID